MILPKLTNHEKGMRAEDAAVDFLQNQKYDILERRYKTKFGEIDLIAKHKAKEETLCFIEVKTRKTVKDGLESITLRTQKRIQQSALFFLSQHPELNDMSMRFDIIVIAQGVDGKFEITHLDNAWACS
ncbi:MAG: YraN family protein [Alphaproteobacteria bacterium]|nr:YraN family protein [Alphaproteobacteria bacterium]